MRLDEWQKFIESQFLEETPPAAVAQKSVRPSEDPQTILPLDDALSEATDSPPTAQTTALDPPRSAQPTVASEADRSATPSAALPPAALTPRQTGFVVRSVPESAAEAPTPLPPVSPIPYGSSLEMETAIPVFADYLPAKSGEPAPLPPEAEAPLPVTLLAEEQSTGPVSVLVPLTSGFVSSGSVPPSSSAPSGRRRFLDAPPQTGSAGAQCSVGKRRRPASLRRSSGRRFHAMSRPCWRWSGGRRSGKSRSPPTSVLFRRNAPN